jgi:AraC-like DNA-binding protein
MNSDSSINFYRQQVERIKTNFMLKGHVYDRLIRTKRFMDIHYATAVDLEMLADQAFYSKFHFIRLFKIAYGRTPNQYLTEVRIQKAKRLLQSDLTIMQVCHAVGFESVSSFSSLFKEITGQTPSAFKSKANPLHGLPKSNPKRFAYLLRWQVNNSNFREVQS